MSVKVDATGLKTLTTSEVDDCMKQFKRFEVHEKAFIPVGNLGPLMEALRCNVTEAEMEEYTLMGDPDGTGNIYYQNFLKIMSKRLGDKGTTLGTQHVTFCNGNCVIS